MTLQEAIRLAVPDSLGKRRAIRRLVHCDVIQVVPPRGDLGAFCAVEGETAEDWEPLEPKAEKA